MWVRECSLMADIFLRIEFPQTMWNFICLEASAFLKHRHDLRIPFYAPLTFLSCAQFYILLPPAPSEVTAMRWVWVCQYDDISCTPTPTPTPTPSRWVDGETRQRTEATPCNVCDHYVPELKHLHSLVFHFPNFILSTT